MPRPATIVLAFANDWVDDKRYLRNLLNESKAIGKALAPLVDAGRLVSPTMIHNATVDEILVAFRAPEDRDRVCIFHFGGHASGATLLFEDAAGQPATAHAEGLAAFLGQQRGLALVFLNGCSTEPQIRRLRDAGVKAVVATTRAIEDTVAAELAAAFYAELATRSLRNAFDAAVAAVQLRRGNDPRSVLRDAELLDDSALPFTPAWPWIIDCDPAYEGWKFGEIPGGRTDWRRVGVAAAVIAALLAVALVVRAFTVASSAEKTAWVEAKAKHTSDGLQAYLRKYPNGHYRDEALSRLAGCRPERLESFSSPRSDRKPLTVIPTLRGLPNEAAARDDAIVRGEHDAGITCAALEVGQTSKVDNARVEPRDWRCAARKDGVVCGFDGDIVCVVRDRMVTNNERCDD